MLLAVAQYRRKLQSRVPYLRWAVKLLFNQFKRMCLMRFKFGFYLVLTCGFWLITSLQGSLWAQTSLVPAPARSLALPTVASAFELPLKSALDPELIWQTTYPITQPANAEGRFSVSAGQRTAVKFTLTDATEPVFTLEVPLVRMDLVQVFWRESGQPWREAKAGDTVALSKWPVTGQFPAFVTYLGSPPGVVDVIMVMQNDGAASTPLNLQSDRESRERRLWQASIAGLLIGASAMVLVINVLLFALYRHRAAAYLVAYCAAVTLGIAVLSGYFAIWFTSDFPHFNDAGKPLIASILSASLLSAGVAALDRQAIHVAWRRASLAAALLILGYGVLQFLVLPHGLRLIGGVASGLVSVTVVLMASVTAWYRGDRYALWVFLATGLFVASIAVVARGYVEIAQVDIYAASMAVLLISSSLVLRYVLVARERFGRAVLSRDRINRYRDPLTALLDYEGFEREVENLSLRQTSEGGVAHVLYFSLTELDNFKSEDGYIVWQRDMVRFAVVLQRVLGEGWHIARLSNSKFAALRLSDQQQVSSEPLLTLVLSHCARKIDTYGWVDRVGLRMAGVHTPLTVSGLQDSMRLMEESVIALEHGKRIALL